jgi:hypothetical protein
MKSYYVGGDRQEIRKLRPAIVAGGTVCLRSLDRVFDRQSAVAGFAECGGLDVGFRVRS